MDKSKIKSETRETYQDFDIKTLKFIVFLTKCLKVFLSKMVAFIGIGIPGAIVAVYMYSNGSGFLIIPITMIVHFIVFLCFDHITKKERSEDYNKQCIIQEELETMIKEKTSLS